MKNQFPELLIHQMHQRHPGFTQPLADQHLEGARVCLDRFHNPPEIFQIQGSREVKKTTLIWSQTDDQTKLAWGNERYATEHGAYACALAAVELVCGLVAISRMETGTGADFYMAPPGSSKEDLETHIRLEVSGVSKGNVSAVNNRFRQKVKQAQKGGSNLPAIIGVVGFLTKRIRLERLEES